MYIVDPVINFDFYYINQAAQCSYAVFQSVSQKDNCRFASHKVEYSYFVFSMMRLPFPLLQSSLCKRWNVYAPISCVKTHKCFSSLLVWTHIVDKMWVQKCILNQNGSYKVSLYYCVFAWLSLSKFLEYFPEITVFSAFFFCCGVISLGVPDIWS